MTRSLLEIECIVHILIGNLAQGENRQEEIFRVCGIVFCSHRSIGVLVSCVHLGVLLAIMFLLTLFALLSRDVNESNGT